jgi:hypothetical protein
VAVFISQNILLYKKEIMKSCIFVAVFAFSCGSLIHASQEPMQEKKAIIYIRKNIQGSITTYHGILDSNKSGTLECKVSCDSDTYTGKAINNGYSKEEWASSGLSASQAKQYYLELLAKDPTIIR